MSENEDQHTLSIQLANQVINMANNRLQEGLEPGDIAMGLRHAAANFTAFAMAHVEKPEDVDPTVFAEEFLQTYAYYFDKHMAGRKPVSSLDALIKQVKDEN